MFHVMKWVLREWKSLKWKANKHIGCLMALCDAYVIVGKVNSLQSEFRYRYLKSSQVTNSQTCQITSSKFLQITLTEIEPRWYPFLGVVFCSFFVFSWSKIKVFRSWPCLLNSPFCYQNDIQTVAGARLNYHNIRINI